MTSPADVIAAGDFDDTDTDFKDDMIGVWESSGIQGIWARMSKDTSWVRVYEYTSPGWVILRKLDFSK